METITSLATTYTFLDEDLIEEILIRDPDQADLVRAASALRLARRALGCSIIAPIQLQFSNAENAAENCKVLTDDYSHLLHLYAVDVYTIAARITFLLSKEK